MRRKEEDKPSRTVVSHPTLIPQQTQLPCFLLRRLPLEPASLCTLTQCDYRCSMHDVLCSVLDMLLVGDIVLPAL